MERKALTTMTPEFARPTMPEPNSEEGSNRSGGFDIPRSLRAYRGAAIAASVVVFIAVVLFGLSRHSRYQSESLISVTLQPTNALSGNAAPVDPSVYEAMMQQVVLSFERRELAEQTVQNMPEGVWRKPGENVESAVTRLVSGFKAERLGVTPEIQLTLDGATPNDTPLALNAIVQQVIANDLKAAGGDAEGRLRVLEDERNNVVSELTSAHDEQVRLNAKLGVASLGVGRNPWDDQVNGLRGELDKARQDSAQAAAQVDATDAALTTDTAYINLRNSSNDRRRVLQNQMTSMTPKNPIYQQDVRELAVLDSELAAAAKDARSRARATNEAALRKSNAVVAALEGQIAQGSSQAVTAGPSVARSNEVAENITRFEARLNAIDDAMRSLRLQKNSPSRFRVDEVAQAPAQKVSGKRKLIMLAAFPLAILAGIAAAVAARKFKDRIFGGDDVRAAAGFPPIAVLPSTLDVSKAVLDEYWLRLASGIENAILRSTARSFVFTSLGHSTELRVVMGNVTRKLEELGYSPLWISANTLLDGSAPAGTGGASSIATQNPGKQMVRHQNSRSNRGAAASRLTALERSYDVVLVDAEPLLESAEAEYAVRRADATILICESGETRRKELKTAIDLLHRLQVTGVGIVVNDVELVYADEDYRARIRHIEERNREPRYSRPSDDEGREVSVRDEAEEYEEDETVMHAARADRATNGNHAQVAEADEDPESEVEEQVAGESGRGI